VGNTPRTSSGNWSSSVHPHACGEHGTIYVYDTRTGGSSPRMWGTHVSRVMDDASWRFIPTHVGNTRSLHFVPLVPPVHPHACGEHGGAEPGKSGNIGSSPRMWGTRPWVAGELVCLRFIPTHVGNTNSWVAARWKSTVHPHACGEHYTGSTTSWTFPGSSPRMWGTPDTPIPCEARLRFIPTHVGNTKIRMFRRLETSVHPHACGEHYPPD